MLARKQFAYENQQDYFNDRNAIGWIREGDATQIGRRMSVLLANGPEASKLMKVEEKYAGKSCSIFWEM